VGHTLRLQSTAGSVNPQSLPDQKIQASITQNICNNFKAS